MSSLTIKVDSGNTTIKTKQHDYEWSQLKEENEAIHIYDCEEDEIDTVVEIVIEDYITILYYMESFGTGLQDLTLCFIDSTNTLLLGGKRKSCSVNIINRLVENEFNHCLFWDFCILENEYILETGELDCLLRDQNGVVLDKVPVDPPWDIFYEDDGVRFESGYYGKQFLKYP